MSEHNIDELARQLDFARAELEQFKQILGETELRQTLIAKLLSATNQNQGVADYFDAVKTDFLEFAAQEDALEDEAAALLALQEIGAELKVVAAYPEFYKKRAVAIAGGFSAGKSEFISSLFNDPQVRLPIGIEPTTAIPTYALNGTQNSLIACSQNGGTIDLLEIDSEFQSKLSHHFIRSFGFNLKTIMPFVFLTTPMPFEHLCLIDTPGYNPSDVADGHTAEDIKTAAEFIHNAETLLWLIGLDSNGTISKSDLDFLGNVCRDTEKPLYIILSKADLRPFDQLQDVMDEIADKLDMYDIEVEGISVYSATLKKEYCYHNKSLQVFLEELNRPSDNHALLMERLYAVDEKYQRAILRYIKENRQVDKVLSGLKLDLLQQGFDDLDAEIYEKINKLKALYVSRYVSSQKAEQLAKLEKVTAKLAAAIDSVFGYSGSLQRKTWTLEDVELDEKFSRLTRKDELPDELPEEHSDSPKKQAAASGGKDVGHGKVAQKCGLRTFWQCKAVPENIVNALLKLYDNGNKYFSIEDYAKMAGLGMGQARIDVQDLLDCGVIEAAGWVERLSSTVSVYQLVKPRIRLPVK